MVKSGETPVLTRDEARQLLDSIDVSTPIGLRGRALIVNQRRRLPPSQVGRNTLIRLDNMEKDGGHDRGR